MRVVFQILGDVGAPDRWVTGLEGDAVDAAIEVNVGELVRAHLRALDVARPNKLGGERTGYYAKAANSVTTDRVKGEVTIVIPHRGMALRYYGGVVRPTGRNSEVTGKPITRLTVPIHARAHGKEARDFPNLKFYKGCLVEVPEGESPGPDSVKLFALVKSTKHEADPTVLPDEAAVLKAGEEALEDVVAGLG